MKESNLPQADSKSAVLPLNEPRVGLERIELSFPTSQVGTLPLSYRPSYNPLIMLGSMEDISHPNQKLCPQCQTLLSVDDFDKRNTGEGRTRLQAYCRKCATRLNTEYKKAKRQRDPQYASKKDAQEKARLPRLAARRANPTPETLAAIICADSRSSAKKKGLTHTLDKNEVLKLIQNPCSYCLDTATRMSLDRIDNDAGYTLLNVVAACIRCNYMRRDIPYEAWKLMVPGVRAALQAGLLAGWDGGTTKKRRRLVGAAGLEPT